MSNTPLARQQFSPHLESAINAHLRLELNASSAYMSMALYCLRDSVALEGLACFFKNQATEEREHMMGLAEYVVKRGGVAVVPQVEQPQHVFNKAQSIDGNDAKLLVETALEMEKMVNQALLDVHKVGENDPHFQDFLEGIYLNEQVESIKEIANYVSQLNRVGGGLGVHLWDQELLQKLKK
eukprot:NODE_840_length_3776_cov_0.567310.p1 type:complete len:182 gc:universal NODE_840_length_3776_cov_0.567310:2573-3118(+)